MTLEPRIVASLGKSALKDVLLTSDADIVEVRLDLVEGDPIQSLRCIRGSSKLPIIATNRLRAEGGSFEGSEEERIDQLLKASEYADLIDIELRAPQRDKFLERTDGQAIISYHDFAGMPSSKDLKSIIQEMSATCASIGKIAVTPKCLRDNLVLLGLLLDAEMPLSVIAMGEIGRHMRAVAPIYGSALTYGYVSEPTAPGQMSVCELRELSKLLWHPSKSIK
jgi:3-dehydroquinate dehydratase-1